MAPVPQRTERDPTERLINLLVTLESSSGPRTFAQLRHDTHAYVQSDDESARRMFERDKDALRRIGIPIETVDVPAGTGYTINRQAWSLQPVRLDRSEATALAVATSLAGGQQERLAMSRLVALAPDPDQDVAPSIRIEWVDDELDAVARAIADGATLAFDYRRSDGDRQRRTVDAWGLAWRNGAAYLIGWDHLRRDRRTFRLSRVTSSIRVVDDEQVVARPDDFDVAEVVHEAFHDGTDVVVRVAPSAVRELAARGGRLRTEDEPDDHGWQVGEVLDTDAVRLRGWLVAAADRVVVVEPGWLREEVVAALTDMAGPTRVSP